MLLHSNLDALARWCYVNQLTLNVRKWHWMDVLLAYTFPHIIFLLSWWATPFITDCVSLPECNFRWQASFQCHFVDIIKMSGFILGASSDFTPVQQYSFVKNILQNCCVEAVQLTFIWSHLFLLKKTFSVESFLICVPFQTLPNELLCHLAL